VKYLIILAIIMHLIGCVQPPTAPELGSIYNSAARQSHVDRNPIIVIPGILGSRLMESKTGQVVWGRFGSGAIDHNSADGMRSIALPLSASAWPRDDVQADGVLSELELAWGFHFRFKAYSQMLAAFGAGGYLDPALAGRNGIDYGKEHFTCFQFAYDWRRSCAENAALLGKFIEEKRRYVAKERLRLYNSTAPVKFDLCAHSMGGLIARYHLMYGDRPLATDGENPVTWAGARHVEKLIVVGTPNGGSVYPMHDIIKGFRLSPLVPGFTAASIGTMPSVYELLPPETDGAIIDEHSRPIPYYDPAEWQRRGWGLMNPAYAADLATLMPDIADPAERQQRARAHLAKLLRNARAFHRAINRDARLPRGLQFHSFAGDAVKTSSRIQVSASGEMEMIDWIPGDGSVTRASVLRDVRKPHQSAQKLRSPIPWTHSYFVFTDHIAMTADPAFVDNVLHLLLERPQ
jgi:pimeloyl-ACP methyl ester carboxylesterase